MCWHSYGWRWEREPERTSQLAKTDDLRIADADRERAISQLSKHAGDGRLMLEEFEARVEQVYAARTNAELRPVFRDLPSNDNGSHARAKRSYARGRFRLEAFVLLLALVFVMAAFSVGPWVLLIGFFVLMPRRRWGGHHRMHRADDERSRDMHDEELTTV